jgi:DNA polymerase III alpha subunit
MAMISKKSNPLDRINLVTIIKIIDFNWYSHSEGDNPYIQISINGLVLTGTGDALHANIQDSAGYGDYEKVNELMSLYTPESMHWIESNSFHFMEGEVLFYSLMNIHPVVTEDVEKINRCFLQKFHSDREPQKQQDILKITTSNVCPDMDNNTVVMSGVLEHVKTSYTNSGKKMAFARLRDDNGVIDLIIFANAYENYEKAISKDGNIIVAGKLDVSESAAYLIPESFEI